MATAARASAPEYILVSPASGISTHSNGCNYHQYWLLQLQSWLRSLSSSCQHTVTGVINYRSTQFSFKHLKYSLYLELSCNLRNVQVPNCRRCVHTLVPFCKIMWQNRASLFHQIMTSLNEPTPSLSSHYIHHPGAYYQKLRCIFLHVIIIVTKNYIYLSYTLLAVL